MVSFGQRFRARRSAGVAGVAVAFAVGLLAASLCGGVLYVSSAGTAAIHQQLDQACPDEVGLTIRTLPFPRPDLPPMTAEDVIAVVPEIDHVVPPIITFVAPTSYTRVVDDGGKRRITLIAREGAGDQVTPSFAPLDEHSFAMSQTVQGLLPTGSGGTIVVDGFPDGPRTMHLTAVFADLGVKVPDYWCGLEKLVGTNPNGDEPPTVGLVDLATLRVEGTARITRTITYQVDPQGMSLQQVKALLARFRTVAADLSERVEEAAPHLGELPTLISRAEGVRGAVDRSTLPAVGAGVASAAAVLAGSGALFARERRRALRLRVMRGAGIASNTVHLARRCLVPALVGAAGGFGAAYVAATRWGPSSITEADAMRSAWIYAAVSLVVGLAVVAGAGALTAAQFVDPTVAHPVVRRAAAIAGLLALGGLVVWSYRRLSDGEGLRIYGVQPQGGSFIAQAFPLLSVCAVAVALVVPVRWLVARVRATGRRLPRPVRAGWRRAVHEPLLTAVLILVTTVAVGCVMLSIVLTKAGTDGLDAKAHQYVGADVSLHVLDDLPPPAQYAGRATTILRGRGSVGESQISVVGIDTATARDALYFADGATRSRSLAALAALTAPGISVNDLNAVAVGGAVRWHVGDEVEVDMEGTIQTVHIVAVLRSFTAVPRTDTTLLLEHDRFDEVLQGRTVTVVVRTPHPGSQIGEEFAASGARVKAVTFADRVFDVSSYSAQRWSYGMLAALGWFFAAVSVLLQVMAAWARRRARQQAQLVLRGNRPSAAGVLLACLVEAAAPMVVGAVLGAVLALAAAAQGVNLLDPLRNLDPASRVDWSGGSLGALAALVAVAVVVCAAFGALVSRPRDPLALMRETV